MRRLALTALVLASTAVGACSLINAPPDEIPGSGGAGGASSTASVTSTATASSTSTASSSATSGGTGGAMCTGPADCAGHADECNDAVCNDGACGKTPKADGTSCNDGLFCTTADVCTKGLCAGVTKVCPEMVGTTGAGGGGGGTGTSGAGGGTTGTGGAGPGRPMPDACHVWSCNEGLKVCEIVPGASGVACTTGDPCTVGETCAPDGTCGNGVPKDCSALTGECAQGVCTPGVGCEPIPQAEGFDCGTMNKCAASKCMAGKCNIVAPTNTGGACDDGLYCTTNDVCQPNGFCGGDPKCVDPTACITSSCDEAAKKCVLDPKADGEACATTACSAGQTCNGGICGGGTVAATYFYENFANNNKGWILGPEWGIAPAAVSPTLVYGADPAQDNSPTGDNGVAGVVIGGNENPVIHPQYYLESPIIDITAAQGQLYLTYFRWLNSDYLPFMKNVVEVFDGTKWVEIWASGNSPGVQDSPPAGQGWTFISHDITQYKNASLKVRFGYDIESSGVYTIGSWNLDDVKLQNTVCPTVP